MTSSRSPRSHRTWVTVLGSAVVFVGAVCLGDDIQSRELLETLPRDRRVSLAENLDRFDRLNPAEQTAIRRLDAAIGATDPVAQARLRAVLHHYHLWFQGLTDEQQATLLAITDPDERFQAARKIRLAEVASPQRDGPRIAKIRTGEYGMIGPYETASLLKVWQKLPPEKQAEIAKKPPAKLRDAIKAQAGAANIKLDSFPADREKVYAAKLETDDEFKPLIEPMIRRVEQAVLKGVAKKADNAQKKFEHPYAEFLYFEENRPRPVSPALMERFSTSCPDWFHAMTDSLSADDARDYFTTVYRLIYPTSEMPEPPKPTKAAPEPAAKKVPKTTKPDPAAPAF